MDIRKPKPWHNWREFLTEIGTIVIGVAIALAGEQGVEALHNQHRADQARENIHNELAVGIGMMDTRDKIEACVSRRLDEVDALIRASAAGKLTKEPIWIGHPFFFLLADGQYKSAGQSGAVSLLPNANQGSYAAIYNAFADFSQAELVEQAAWGDLRVLENHPASTPVTDWQLRSALQKARTARWEVETAAHTARVAIAGLAIKPVGTFGFTQPSVCIPLNTLREEGERLVVKGRTNGVRYDEP